MQACRVRDLEIHYEAFGAGRPLLMLHGWPADHRHMVNDLEPLFAARQGWRRLYPDLPGMGRTRGADWITRQDHMLDAVLEFMDAVAPGERFAVAGTSYGGYLARGMVYRRGAQIDGLLLNVPLIEADPEKLDLPRHRVLREDAQFMAATQHDTDGMRELAVMQSPELFTELKAAMAVAACADQAFLQRLGEHYAFSFDIDALATPFPAPALLLTGRFDNCCGYREAYRILDHYPRATYAVLDGAGHLLSLERKNLFHALAGDWLDRVEAYTTGPGSSG